MKQLVAATWLPEVNVFIFAVLLNLRRQLGLDRSVQEK